MTPKPEARGELSVAEKIEAILHDGDGCEANVNQHGALILDRAQAAALIAWVDARDARERTLGDLTLHEHERAMFLAFARSLK